MDTTPEPDVRPPLELAADEVTTLVQFLDFFRAELHGRAWGLRDQDRSRRIAASDLTLAGLVKHMASVEHTWFVYRFLGLEPQEPWASAPWDDDEDWEFHSAGDDSASALFSLYTESCAESRTITAEAESLDQLSVRTNGDGDRWSLRWILVHMIEEYARHCGHADLLREAIDGTTG